MDCWSFVYGAYICYSVGKCLSNLKHMCKHYKLLLKLQPLINVFRNKSYCHIQSVSIDYAITHY